MGQLQIWQYEGLGTDWITLKKVLNTYRKDGVQGQESQCALDRYIRQLDDDRIRKMFRLDEEAAIQLLSDCLGVVEAFRKYAGVAGGVKMEAAENQISISTHNRIVEGYKKKLKEIDEESRRYLSSWSETAEKEEKVRERLGQLQKILTEFKADLYDFYAQAGKVPDYEGRMKAGEEK